MPVVEFYAGGKHIEGSTDIESIWATKYREGQSIEIRYNENNPEEFVVKGKSFGSNLLIAGAGIILGAALIVLSFKK